MAEAMAVEQLRHAFNSGTTRPYAWRVAQIEAVKRLMDAHEAQLCKALRADLGKSSFEANYTELDVVRNSCDYMLKNLKKLMAPSEAKVPFYMKGSKATITAEPFGVVLIISAWNYPVLLALDPLVAALAAGNSVTLKLSESAKATSMLLKNLVSDYLDSSAVKAFNGDKSQSAALLEQKWDKIFYTGGPVVGRIVMAAAARHLTPVTLELGGKCATIVDKTADLEMAARRIAATKWMVNAGQTCISPDYILAHHDISDRLIQALEKAVKEFITPLPASELDPDDATIPHIINIDQFQRLKALLQDAGTENIVFSLGEPNEENLLIMPTILRDPPRDCRLMQEEIFGPILPVLAVKDMEEAIEVVNSKPKPLAMYVFTQDKEVEQDVAEKTSSGSLVINDVGSQFYLESLPFGGVGDSGMGSYHGRFGFDTFSHMKPVLSNYKDNSQNENRTRYPPYSKKAKSILRACLRKRSLFDILLLGIGVKKE